jgi:hypothetical protein
MFRCTRCRQIMWVEYHKLPGNIVLCSTCYQNEQENDNEEKQRIIKEMEQEIHQILQEKEETHDPP